MDFLKKIFRKESGPPKWDVKPPSQRPAPRVRQADDDGDTAVATQKPAKPEPKLADGQEPDLYLNDTGSMSLELEAEAIPEDNPYESRSSDDTRQKDQRAIFSLPQIQVATHHLSWAPPTCNNVIRDRH